MSFVIAVGPHGDVVVVTLGQLWIISVSQAVLGPEQAKVLGPEQAQAQAMETPPSPPPQARSTHASWPADSTMVQNRCCCDATG